MQEPPETATLREFFSLHNQGISAVYLFGSRARGDAQAGSDADVAVLYIQDPPPGLRGLALDLADDLRKALRAPVDLVVLNRASPDLIHRVLRDGILVCEYDRAARVRFEVDARRRYFDLLPYLREYRHTRSGTRS
ncbi:MAG: nucleotidyltransferase domain-containing protein [Gammaproteobacteria bacterium]|nr:nucleotidyltransferase domain-containing protein [Gammaproteobacteria bacterium]